MNQELRKKIIIQDQITRMYSDIPPLTAAMIAEWVFYPASACGFIKAIADNDLFEAVCKADTANRRVLPLIALVMLRDTSLLRIHETDDSMIPDTFFCAHEKQTVKKQYCKDCQDGNNCGVKGYHSPLACL